MSKFRLLHPKLYQILEFLSLSGTTSIPAPKSWDHPHPPTSKAEMPPAGKKNIL